MRKVLFIIVGSLFLSLFLPHYACSQNGTLHQLFLTVSGDNRQYLLYEPENYNGVDEWPIVFVFHGFSMSGTGMISTTEMYKVADTADFFVVYPHGMYVHDVIWNMYNSGWHVPPVYAADHDDVEFVGAMIDDIIFNPDFSIDTNRIFAGGFSNGAEMSYYLACTLSDRIASFAGVVGQMSLGLMDTICNPQRPASVLHLLGTEDQFFPELGDTIFPPLAGTSEYWASIDNCEPIPDTTYLPDLYTQDASTVTLLQYPNCDDGYEVLCYRIEGGVHGWPGGGQQWMPGLNQDIDASSEIWNFFRRNPHPRAFSFCFPMGITFTSQEDLDNFPILNPNCTEILGDVVVNGNDITNLEGLNMITGIGGSLSIFNNNALPSLDGLENLVSIGGNLEIGKDNSPLGTYGNEILQDLSGMENLLSIGGNLFIAYNYSLISLEGLDNIAANSIDSLFIYDNENLSHCAVLSVCDYLADPSDTVDIHDNAEGCNDSSQVAYICHHNPGVGEHDWSNNFYIYPNPASQELHISAEGLTVDEVIIYAITGQQTYALRPENSTIDISHIQQGMYIVEVIIENVKIRRKLLVE